MPRGIRLDGSVLRELRLGRLWTQRDLAARCVAFAAAHGDPHCGLNRESVSKLERGHRAPTFRTVRYLVGVLAPDEHELHRLLGRHGEPEIPALEARMRQQLLGLRAQQALARLQARVPGGQRPRTPR
jgi:transcriptional regulator with XRE-family HTH domain